MVTNSHLGKQVGFFALASRQRIHALSGVFSQNFPHIEMFAQLQKRGVDPVFMQSCIANLPDAVTDERSEIHAILATDVPKATLPRDKRPRVGSSSADKSHTT